MDAPQAVRARQQERYLEIDWGEGHVSVYPYGYLREHCECAVCRDEWTGERRGSGAVTGQDLTITSVELVGNYAIRIRWSDGHDTGLYTWEHLRSLCRCTRCAPIGKSDETE